MTTVNRADATASAAESSAAASVESDRLIGAFSERLAELRSTRGLSLEQLADRSGLSIGSLSQLQRGIGNPSFLTIAKIAYALDVPISTFFETGDSLSPVVRKDERKKLIAPVAEHGLVYELLTPDLNRMIEATWSEFPPGTSNEERPFTHKGEECGLVIEGQLEVHLGADVYVLEAGDSISYRSTTPHWYRNPGRKTTKVVWITCPPSF